MIDNYKDKKQIIITGSSTFNLLDNTSEPLTGRKFTFELYPLSVKEVLPELNSYELKKQLESFLIYGMYPEIVNEPSFDQKEYLLKDLAASYLYKDILELQNIRNPTILRNLLQLLALQIGSEVSYNELSMKPGIDVKTIEKYIDLLEKNFIVYRLPAFSRNPRNEISRGKKIFFYDLGIRNMIIDTFTPLKNRENIGDLWENFVINERRKYLSYNKIPVQQYFWRSTDNAEIDLIEQHGGKLHPFEIKWNPKKARKAKLSPSWIKQYEGLYSDLIALHTENVCEFL